MLQATDVLPLNVGLTGKGNSSRPEGLDDQVRAGAVGLKLHEDWGTTPPTIDGCLRVADAEDVQVTIHTDTLNESGYVDDTLAAIAGRTIHTYHTRGRRRRPRARHHPRLRRAERPSEHAPTRPGRSPSTRSTSTSTCSWSATTSTASIPEDVAFAESRIRGETIAAEDVLHDLGAHLDDLERQPGDGPHRRDDHPHLADGALDGRAARRVWPRSAARTTTCASAATSPSTPSTRRSPTACRTRSARVEVGKLADIVLWQPAFFGARPELVLKGGMIAWAQMGDANASIPTPQPLFVRPMFGALGGAVGATSHRLRVAALAARGDT